MIDNVLLLIACHLQHFWYSLYYFISKQICSSFKLVDVTGDPKLLCSSVCAASECETVFVSSLSGFCMNITEAVTIAFCCFVLLMLAVGSACVYKMFENKQGVCENQESTDWYTRRNSY